MKGLIFTYLLTFGGSLAALAEPYVGLLVYVCFSIIKPNYLWSWSVPEGNFSRIVGAAMLAGWAIQAFGRWRLGRAATVVTLLLSFLGWEVLSAIAAPNQEVAWRFIEDTCKFILPFLVGITTIDSVDRLKRLAWVITLSHAYVGFELNLSYYTDGFNIVRELGFGGMDNNSFAISLVACTGLALFLGMHAERLSLRAVALFSALIMIHTVMLTYSRGGMIALILTAFVSFLLIPKRAGHFLVYAVILLICARLAGPEVQERFLSSFADEKVRDASAESRVRLWSDCTDAMMRNPVLGVGPRHWPLIAHTYGWPQGKEGHSLWLQVGAELGVPGLLLLVLFYGLCVVRLIPLARETSVVPDPWLRYLARAVIASLCGFALAAQFVNLVGLETPYYIALIGAGALKLASVPVEESGSSDAGGAPVMAPAGAYAD